MVSSRHQVPGWRSGPRRPARHRRAGAWVTSAASSAGLPFMEYQTIDLVLGGVLVVTGVHARNFPFLHARSVLAAMPWPLDAGRLWQRALRRQRRPSVRVLGGALSVFAAQLRCSRFPGASALGCHPGAGSGCRRRCRRAAHRRPVLELGRRFPRHTRRTPPASALRGGRERRRWSISMRGLARSR